MKKLKLKLDGVKEMLTREQMKKVSGGYGGGGDNCPYSYHCGEDIWTGYDPALCVLCGGTPPSSGPTSCPDGYTLYACPNGSEIDTICSQTPIFGCLSGNF